MKKYALLLAGLVFAGAAAAQATGGGFTGKMAAPANSAGGFAGPVSVVTAEQAKTLRDDTPVTLRGTIDSHLGGKRYLFKDASGTVPVEIKDKRWQDQKVSPQDPVQIDGEVDVEHGAVEIEVKRLRKL